MIWIYAAAGLFAGAILAWFFLRNHYRSRYPLSRESVEALSREKQRLEVELEYAARRGAELTAEGENTVRELEEKRAEVLELSVKLTTSESQGQYLKQKLDEQKAEIEQIQEKFSHAFRNLATEILEEKSRKFTDQNKANIGDLLNPLRQKIEEFEKKVEQTNKESIDRNSALRQQIESLYQLNQRITKEAENLTRALKGESKTQGNWGEFILESIMEKSGLARDREYFMQESVQTEEGKRLQPDVVVKLPEDKSIIIDSKVSLLAYERFVNAETEEEKIRHLRDHVLSVRTHIRGLSEKNYQQLYGVSGLDFVLLFMPVEPAFSLAVQNDDRLFLDAYESNIVVVSPSTLIATLRTIASIWKQERQNRNAMEIAKQGGMLYDKFKAFTDDLVKVGDNLRLTKGAYEQAMNKLTEGRDNLVRKAERLRELGARSSKQIDQRLIDRSSDEE
jgi:DNA recombination protein RmuC